TNSDPSDIDFPIPANDDATKSIDLISSIITKAIQEGLEERKRDKEEEAEKEAAAAKAQIDNAKAAKEEAKSEEGATSTGGSETETPHKRPRKASPQVEAAAKDANEEN